MKLQSKFLKIFVDFCLDCEKNNKALRRPAKVYLFSLQENLQQYK
jgi:hypothetical protein